jgi:rhamnose transport system substrate-binding protein
MKEYEMKLRSVFRGAVAIGGVLLSASTFAANCATAPVTVGFVPKLDTDPYFQVAQSGAEEAAAEIGGKAIKQAPSQVSAEAQIEFINNMVAHKVGVIAIAGNDAHAVAPALRRAAGQGIRVISYDSDVAADARTLFINQVQGDSLAAMMLDSMYQMIHGEGEFAILSSVPTATNQNAWIEFIKKKIAADPKYVRMKLVQIAYGEESEQTNQQQALGLAQAFPHLKGIIIPAGIGLPAAARALEQAGLAGKIKLTGLAPATLIKKYITAGEIQDISWNVKDLGYLTYYAAQALAQCKVTGREGETFKAGRLGEYKIGGRGEVVLGAARIVTPENIKDFPF